MASPCPSSRTVGAQSTNAGPQARGETLVLQSRVWTGRVHGDSSVLGEADGSGPALPHEKLHHPPWPVGVSGTRDPIAAPSSQHSGLPDNNLHQVHLAAANCSEPGKVQGGRPSTGTPSNRSRPPTVRDAVTLCFKFSLHVTASFTLAGNLVELTKPLSVSCASPAQRVC